MPKIIYALALAALASSADAEVVTYECHFDYRIDGEGRAEESMVLTFKIDTTDRSAFMEGNAGISPIDVHVGDKAVSFIESAGSGAVMATTVTRDGIAVHSRNTVLFGQFVAAQHFGFCLVS